MEGGDAPLYVGLTSPGGGGGDLYLAKPFLTCSTCGKWLRKLWMIKEHKSLGVGMCVSCYDFLHKSPFTKGADGNDEQCHWCGRGGRLVLCDQCDKSFCEICVIRNIGPKYLEHILGASSWTCFSCDCEIISEATTDYSDFVNLAQERSRQPSRSQPKRH